MRVTLAVLQSSLIPLRSATILNLPDGVVSSASLTTRDRATFAAALVLLVAATAGLSYLLVDDGAVIARPTATSSRAVLAAWEVGDSLSFGAAPARRAAMFPSYNTPPQLNDTGRQLILNTIDWLMGGAERRELKTETKEMTPELCRQLVALGCSGERRPLSRATGPPHARPMRHAPTVPHRAETLAAD